MSPTEDLCDGPYDYQHSEHDVWKPMSFRAFDAEELDNTVNGIKSPSSVLHLDGGVKPGVDLGQSLRLPDLENFSFGESIDQEPPENDSTLSHSEIGLSDLHISQDKDYDIWESTNEPAPGKRQTQLLTWEAFNHNEQPALEPSLQYLSESGPAMFDAALHKAFSDDVEKQHLVGVVVQTEIFLRSVVELGLGRSSVVFPYDKRSGSFSQAIEGVRMTGYSGTTTGSVVEEFIAVGNSIVQLRSFSDSTLSSSHSLPEHVALASCMNSILDATEVFVMSTATSAQTLTQIQGSFEKPFNLIRVLFDLVNKARNRASPEYVRQIIFRKVTAFEETQDALSMVLRVIFDRVTSPLLESLAQRVGLETSQQTLLNDGDDHDDERQEDEFFDATETVEEPQSQDGQDPVELPELITPKDSKLVTETSMSLDFLLRAAPDELISRPYLLVDQRPKLSWAFTLEDADGLRRKALNYEASIKEELRQLKLGINNTSVTHSNIEPTNDSQSTRWNLLDDEMLAASIPALDQFPIYETNVNPDKVTSAALEYFKNPSSQQPGIPLPIETVISMSLGPILTAQHNFLSAAALRTLLDSNSLRTHLKVYREFHLHGSGAFTSRLAAVLFSPELVPAERVKGVVRAGQGMGLRLGSGTRRDWPPASSEIRLALMGVLNDSWNDITSPAQRPQSRQRPSSSTTAAITNDSKDLPGGLSFAIRELSEPEIERVLDSDSIYALDFLRLSHSPPPALKILFTPKLLSKYDRVFKLLLRTQRVKFVLDLLFRNTVARTSKFENQLSHQNLSTVQLFISQARHFTLTISTHFELSGISRPWRAFQSQIGVLEELLSSDSNRIGCAIPSLSTLTSAHATTLNRITSSLFLRKRHAHVAGVLDEILGDVLALAKSVRDGESANVSIKALFTGFRAHVNAFLDACNGLGLKSATKKGRESNEEEEDAGPESARMLVELLDWR